MSDSEPLLPVSGGKQHEGDSPKTLRERTAIVLEARRAHQLVIFLTIIDTACVLADLSYTLLSSGCEPPSPEYGPQWLEVLADISLAITCVFLIEIPLTLWSLGLQHYNPFGDVPHSSLHLFDAGVIVTTFVLEFILRGKERELAELLIVLRLWRLVKLVGGVAVGATEIEEDSEEVTELKEQLNALQERLAFVQDENRNLRARLTSAEGTIVD